ncbi:MAG: YkgJ family cysteine cluster protein [Planctomycetes bacterium]|nr:YkgJ family cysteine cluster protein [Planctomycetota bacterium]
MAKTNSARPWYRDGLKFSCQGCGDCCRGPGGYVWVTLDEAEQLAAAVGMEFDAFAAAMLRRTPQGLALVDDGKGDCPLLGDDGRCRVYHQRPLQCKTWPWWSENLLSEQRWNDVATRCPGMNAGALHSALYIEAEAAKDF